MPLPERDIPSEVLQEIGRLVVNYATLESLLRWLIADLLFADEEAAIATVKLQMRALVETADALYWHRRPAVPEEDWKHYVQALEAIQNSRNSLIHADWFRTIDSDELHIVSSRLRRGKGWVIQKHSQSASSVRAAADEALRLANVTHDMIVTKLTRPS